VKKFFSSMSGRVFLLLVAGVVASVSLTLALASRERQEELSQVRNVHAVDRVEQLVVALEAASPEARPGIAAAARLAGIRADFTAAANGLGNPDAEFTQALCERLGREGGVDATMISGEECIFRMHPGNGTNRAHPPICRAVRLNLHDGTPLRLVLGGGRDFGPPPLDLHSLPYLLLFLLCIGGLAYAVARMATRPLRQLEQAAIEFGRDIERPPLPEHGPTEVGNAARAFNAMQARIHRHVQERTRILAAITHDLQTPLTRLRLRLEKVQEEALRDKLVADLSAMQDMVKEGLELAQSMDSGEKMQPLDLDSLLDSVCADAVDAGQDVTFGGKSGISLQAQSNALRRCLNNLVDNAVKYGGSAEVAASRAGAKALIRIRDHGAGIPEEELETVFDPFYRRESSRSRETGGTGLGLTIARNIAGKHGGTLKLRNHPNGGLEAVLELPLEK
jgi:signal transduction histidine kinase